MTVATRDATILSLTVHADGRFCDSAQLRNTGVEWLGGVTGLDGFAKACFRQRLYFGHLYPGVLCLSEWSLLIRYQLLREGRGTSLCPT